jgi:hypothetical protein
MVKKQKKGCRICGGKEFEEVINFGDNPLVNSLLSKEDLKNKEGLFPLVVEQCQDCKLVQIVEPIDSHKIYRDVDYLYFSGDMPKLGEYFKKYAEDLKNRFIEKDDLVVEIGSNDGLMLGFLQDKAKVLGVDPASNVVVRALKNGIPTISDFFTDRLAHSILREFGDAKVIFGNNCIAHLDGLKDLMDGVKTLLSDDGVFVVECNYWGGMVKNKNYSLIYHDHFSYFSVQVWSDFVSQFGMEVFDAVITPAQGGSLRIFIANEGYYQPTSRFIELLEEERKTGLNTTATCKKFNKEVKERAKKLGDFIRKIKDEGSTIAGYGAAAKGFSLLKLAEIDERHIDYFVDDSPAKQGKYTPVSHIPVISMEEAKEKLPDYFFITAPNYTKIIVEKNQDYLEQGGKFITADAEIICKTNTK